MTSDFLIFQRFINREAAQDVLDLLTRSGIEGRLVEEVPITDGLTTFQSAPNSLVMLRGADFGRARDLLQQAADEQAARVTDDHYLFGFTDVELWQVLTKPDEWSALDVTLAQRVLRERGGEMPVADVQEMAAARVRELAQPRDMPVGWLVLGYISAGVGGMLGILLGWYLRTHLTTLPDGRQVPAYSAQTRLHGRVMMIIGTVVFVGLLIGRVVRQAG